MEARKFWITALCLGLLTVCSGNQSWARNKKEPTGAELKAKMEAEGWSQISEGVFERRRSATKVEHLAYGREGFAWTVSELNRRLDALREEYQNYPSGT
jgi:hypothetical protein